jgi:hypothetical protein
VHLRNQYQKVGMFGNAAVPIAVNPGDNDFKGDQVRGFGYLHDGAVDTDYRFVSSTLFDPIPGVNADGISPGPDGEQIRQDLAGFMLAFPSNLAPIVGQQITLNLINGATAGPRIDLLESSATIGQCELVAKTHIGLREAGFLFTPAGYLPDQSALPPVPGNVLRALALAFPVTYTCVPVGSGRRIAIDRDGDGVLDGDE